MSKNWWEESPEAFAAGFAEEVIVHHTPRVGEQRIDKHTDIEQRYWRWQFDLAGSWVFRQSMTTQEVADFTALHRWLYADDQHDYYAA